MGSLVLSEPRWWPGCRNHLQEKLLQRHLLLEKLRQAREPHQQRELLQAKLVQQRQEEGEEQSQQLSRRTHQQRSHLRKKTLCPAVSVGESLQRTGLRHTRRSVQRPQART